MADVLTIDAETGETATRPMTAQEKADADQRAAAEVQRQQVEQSARTNRQTIVDAAQAALASNKTYANLANPTAAQTTAQVKALSRQQNGTIRLLLGLLDAAD